MSDPLAQVIGRFGYEVDDRGLKRFEQGLDKGARSAGKFNKRAAATATALGNLAATAVRTGAAIATQLIQRVASAGDEIAKTSKALGINAQDYQRLRFAAQRSGADIAVLDRGLRSFTKGLVDAQQKGTGPVADGLDALGLSFEQLQGLGIDQQFAVISEALRGVADAQERAGIAAQLFGTRSGPALKPLLDEGSSGIKALGDRAEQLGGVIDEKTLKASEDLEDALLDMKTASMGAAVEIATALLPAVTDASVGIADWVANNRDLIEQDLPQVMNAVASATRAAAEAAGYLVRQYNEARISFQKWRMSFANEDEDSPFGFLALGFSGGADRALLRLQGKERNSKGEIVDRGTGDVGRKVADVDMSEYERVAGSDLADVVAADRDGKALTAEAVAAIKAARARQAVAEAQIANEQALTRAERIRQANAAKGKKRKKGKRGGGGGRGEGDTDFDEFDFQADDLFGDRLRDLAGLAGASEAAIAAAIAASGDSLGSGASEGVAFKAGLRQLEQLTGAKLEAAGLGDALMSALSGGGSGLQGGAGSSPTAGARFVRIDASFNAPTQVTLTLPDGAVGTLGAGELLELVSETVGDELDERNRRAYDHFRQAVNP